MENIQPSFPMGHTPSSSAHKAPTKAQAGDIWTTVSLKLATQYLMDQIKSSQAEMQQASDELKKSLENQQ